MPSTFLPFTLSGQFFYPVAASTPSLSDTRTSFICLQRLTEDQQLSRIAPGTRWGRSGSQPHGLSSESVNLLFCTCNPFSVLLAANGSGCCRAPATVTSLQDELLCPPRGFCQDNDHSSEAGTVHVCAMHVCVHSSFHVEVRGLWRCPSIFYLPTFICLLTYFLNWASY